MLEQGLNNFSMTSKYFYRNLDSFKYFKGITEDKYFRHVPEDWKIIVTDIKDSTKAIEASRYKDVNTIGAASIVSAHNAMGDLEFPYVFGGDGATFLIPAEYQEKIRTELIALKEISQMQFGLELRIGMLGVDEIVKEGVSIELAKFVLVRKKSVAIFRGGGLTIAEKKVKGNTQKYEIKSDVSCSTDLHKLSCRWKPIPAKRGKVLSLLVVDRKKDRILIYEQILNRLEEIYEGQLEDANPINLSQMGYNSFLECYSNERRLHSSPWSFAFLRRLIEIMGSVLVYRFGVAPLMINPRRYMDSLATHSDYRKFDDMLKMIIDCSPTQVNLIRSFLEKLYQRGDIYYGVHESDNALMTCFVDWTSEGEHIHFIDGGNGGYAMAANGLKSQLVKKED